MSRKPGILMIGHGSRDRKWVSLVDGMAAAVQDHLPEDIPAEAAFLEQVEGRLIQDGIDRLEEAGVTDLLVIPLFVSSGSHHVQEIGWALGAFPGAKPETELAPLRISARLTYGRPMDDDPEIVEILLDRLSLLSNPLGRMKESVLLIGHGSDKPGLCEKWQAGLSSLAHQVREAGGYADAAFAMLRPDTAAEAVRLLREKQPDTTVLAVPVFMSEGYFTKIVIPQRLAGLGCQYGGSALLPHTGAALWAVRQALEWLRHRHFL